MKTKLLLKLSISSIMMIAAYAASAQIVYSDRLLNINNSTSNTFFGMKINSLAGLWWTCNTSNFFQIDVSPTNPRLAGTGDQIVFYNTVTKTYNSIQVANVYNYSDMRAKKDIEPLRSGLDMIMGLKPVSYNWKETVEAAKFVSGTDSVTPAKGPAAEEIQYGFLAQDVEKAIPNAVVTDADGHKLVNYTAIFTVLVQAVQELQNTVDEQSKKIEQLMAENAYYSKDTRDKGLILGCTPNPSSGLTTVSVQLSDDVSSAVLEVRGLDGNEEARLDIPQGATSVILDCSALKKGMHIVTLIADDTVCDSAKLIKE